MADRHLVDRYFGRHKVKRYLSTNEESINRRHHGFADQTMSRPDLFRPNVFRRCDVSPTFLLAMFAALRRFSLQHGHQPKRGEKVIVKNNNKKDFFFVETKNETQPANFCFQNGLVKVAHSETFLIEK